jgi:hypothetical protein
MSRYYSNEPHISLEDNSISKNNGGYLYGEYNYSDYMQASGAIVLTRNYKTACVYDPSQLVDFAKDIDSGGWEVKRFVPGSDSDYVKWHPATDQLVGTDFYGVKGCTILPWSEEFTSSNFDQFLFINGDKSKWIIMSRLEVIGTDGAPAWYNNANVNIVKSSVNPDSYQAKMYRRNGNIEDPLITIEDNSAEAANNGAILYAAGFYSHN